MASAAANLWVLVGLSVAGILLVARRLKKAVKVDFGAFVERFELLPPPPPAPPKAPHPLSGLSFAVSDIFDIKGYVTGFGIPEWTNTHDPAVMSSPSVSVLVNNGATCVGKTVIDELGYSLSGENKHFGAPDNPVALDRISGGSSGGSAVAVSAGIVEFSLGIDTIGGVRLPAAYCGILGFRPSFGALTSTGVLPVSPSLDCIGLFSKDPRVLHRVGHILLQLPYSDKRPPRRIMMADDCFQLVKMPGNQISQVVTRSIEKLFGKQVLNHINLGDYLAARVPSLKQLSNQKVKSLTSLGKAMEILHSQEFKNMHGEWIESVRPTLSSSLLNQMDCSVNAGQFTVDHCQSTRSEMRSALNALLKDNGLLVIPTVPGSPPKHGSREILSEDYHSRTLSLLAIASMSGCCQATIPLGFQDKSPVSVSIIARHGGDRFLLDSVQTMYTSLQEHLENILKSTASARSLSPEESAELSKEKGNAAYKDKQWQKAIGFYSEAIRLSGKNATYYSNRAAAYLETGSYLQAESDCTAAIGLDKKGVKAYLRRGTARELLGYYKEAVEDFKYALILEPTNKTANAALTRLQKLFQ